MNIIYKYIEDCLIKTFGTFPDGHLVSEKILSEGAINQTIFDTNVKYQGRRNIGSEQELLEIVKTDPTLEAILLYRIEREIFLKSPDNPLLSYLASLMHRQTGCEIYYSTEIGKGFNIQHGFGIVIGPRYIIGDYFTIHQGVTLGQKNLNSPTEKITIGNNVTIFAGAIILGNLNIGDNTKIGANSVLLTDTERDSVYTGVPAKRIK